MLMNLVQIHKELNKTLNLGESEFEYMTWVTYLLFTQGLKTREWVVVSTIRLFLFWIRRCGNFLTCLYLGGLGHCWQPGTRSCTLAVVVYMCLCRDSVKP